MIESYNTGYSDGAWHAKNGWPPKDVEGRQWDYAEGYRDGYRKYWRGPIR